MKKFYKINGNNVVNVKEFNPPMNGVDYDDEYIQEACNYAVENGLNLYLPAGDYLFKAPESESTACVLLPESSDLNIEIYGDGDSTVITVEDNIDHGFGYCSVFGNTAGMTSTLTSPLRGGYGIVTIRNMRIEGSWAPTYNDATLGRFGRNLFGFSQLDHLKTKYITVNNWQNKYSRGGFHKRYTAMFNTVNICASDVFRAQESENVVISFNKVKNADDDAIAVHSEKSTGESNSAGNVLIQGNIIEDSESIICLGGKVVNISNNIITRSHGTCLAVVSLSAYPEGQSPSHSININNNTITDPLTRAVDGLFSDTTEDQAAITVGRSFVSPDSNGDVPTRPDSTGFITPAYDRLDSVNLMYANDFYTQPSSGGLGVNITGNTITRTMPSSASYSDLGHGLYIDRFGEWDPDIDDDAILYSGITAVNDINGLIISMNSITSMNMNGIRLRRVESSSDTWEMGLNNVSILGNTIIDCTQGFGTNIPEASFAVNWSINITGNTFDCDPYLKDSDRNSDGSWVDSIKVSDLCSGIMIRNIHGVTARDNIFKNCFKPITQQQTDSSTAISYSGSGNIVYCDPVSANYNAGNKGVGNIGYGSEYSHIIYNADPTSSSYGEITTNPNKSENGMPTTGTYVQGFTINRGNILSGGTSAYKWVRVTTGTGHVLGTDWKAISFV